MKQSKILHICLLDKFIPPFIDFVERNFDFDRHVFVLIGDIVKFPVQISSNIIHLNLDSRIQYFSLLREMHLAHKIILHSIFFREIVRLLSYTPWLLAKCYWVMWGADLYHYQLRSRDAGEDRYERIRARVIRKMGHFVTTVKGDYELAREWYGAHGEYHECLAYPSNLYKEHIVQTANGAGLCILLGNSADPSNNHDELFERLIPFKSENVLMYCPLSYGQPEYAKRIAELGKELFGNKFIPLLEFMPFEKYLALLGQIDIAVFAHKRQQALGNTITLLGLGKKVHMRSDVTPWALFDQLGVEVFEFRKFDLSTLNDAVRKHNQARIKSHFSEATLVAQLHDIFEG